DLDRVQLALDDASALIDAYVGQVYRLPITGCAKPVATPGADPEFVAPPQLVRLCCDLARPSLCAVYVPDEHEIAQRRKQAIKDLENIATGKATLACPWGGEPGVVLAQTAQSPADVSYSFSRRSVSDDDLRGF
ncbi:phage protein Gp36 family protein, partial [Ideonella sp.]|uniref:phage protein Gp36 family protein n=1 Tax=Ideonella sp. TaxID=1929293 RepID=UPI003BB740C7